MLGSTIAECCFPFEEVLGQTIVLNKEQYLVIGVIKNRMPRGTSTSGQQAEDFNRDVYMPIKTCRARFGEKVVIRQGGSRTAEQVQLHQITLTTADIDKVRSTGDVVRNLLAQNHQKNDWEVHVPLDRLEEAERARARYMRLLLAIAGISLVVGGIGIMNIMLATVTERTREIGIRRALGAKRRDIIMQFMIEAVVQTSIGGILGIAAGLLIMVAVPFVSRLFSEPVPTQLEPWSIGISLGSAVLVGVVAGLYPAYRALAARPGSSFAFGTTGAARENPSPQPPSPSPETEREPEGHGARAAKRGREETLAGRFGLVTNPHAAGATHDDSSTRACSSRSSARRSNP